MKLWKNMPKTTSNQALIQSVSRIGFFFGLLILSEPAICTEISAVGDGVFLGAGYDPVLGTIHDKCITSDSTNKAKNTLILPTDPNQIAWMQSMTGGAQSIVFAATLIENSQELESALGLNASASYTPSVGTSLSAKESFSQSINMNSYNVYALVSVKIFTESETLLSINLTPAALNLASSNAKQFRRVCGTEFVFTSTRGAELYGVIEINTKSKTEQETVTAEIKGGSGGFSASADITSRLKNATNNKSLNIKLWASGTLGDTLPTNIDEMLKFAAHFPKPAIQNPTVFKSVTRDYSKVMNWPETVLPIIENRQEILTKLRQQYKEYIKNVNDISYILNNSDQFEKFERNALVEKKSELHTALDRIITSTQTCMNSVENCKWESLSLSSVNVVLPNRLQSAVILCHKTRDPICGIESYIVKQSEWCGSTLNTGTGTVCGVASYNSGKGPVCGSTPTPIFGLYTFPLRMTDAAQKNAWCVGKGYDLSTGRIGCHGEPGGGPGTCQGANQPRNNEFVQCAKYNTCSNEAFGVQAYNTCAHESFGRTLKVCAHEQHGVAQYKECNITNNEPHQLCD